MVPHDHYPSRGRIIDMIRMVLLRTVGDSYQSVIKAIKSCSPDYVCFFCRQGFHVSPRASVKCNIGTGWTCSPTWNIQRPV